MASLPHISLTDRSDIYAVCLSELLQSFGCVQHAAEPTHAGPGHHQVRHIDLGSACRRHGL